MKAKSLRQHLENAWQLHRETLPQVRKRIRTAPYDGVVGTPAGLSGELLRRFVRAQEVLLIERRNSTVIGIRSAEQVSAWIGAHKAGKLEKIPERMKASVAVLVSVQSSAKTLAKVAGMATAKTEKRTGDIERFRVKLEAWVTEKPGSEVFRRGKSIRSLAAHFALNPKLYRNLNDPDSLPELNEETIRKYIGAIRKK